MNETIREGNNPYLAMAVSAFLSLLVGFGIAKYTTDYSAQINSQNSAMAAEASEVRANQIELEHVKSDAKNDEATVSRVEGIAQSALASANSVGNQMGALKTALDSQTEGFHALQKQVEAMDRWLRPDPSLNPPVGRR